LTDIENKLLRNIAKRVKDRGFDYKNEKLFIEKKYIADVQRSDASKTVIKFTKTK
jgi:hypothetical protein